MLQKIQTKNFDVAFIDLRILKKNRIETILEIRNGTNINSDLKVLTLTTNTMKQEVQYYKELGFDDVITKPFTREGIIKSRASFFS